MISPDWDASESQRERMLRGDLYDAADAELSTARQQARLLLRELNSTIDGEARQRLYAQLFGSVGKGFWIEPPFFCDYGSNIRAGDRVFFNFNCVVLDPAEVVIGNDVLFGPAVQIYTATHPMDYQTRRKWLELAKPIAIGSDIWIGGGAIICPGVTIGDRSVIGAGSVVTKSIPAGVFAAGNPAKVIKEII